MDLISIFIPQPISNSHAKRLTNCRLAAFLLNSSHMTKKQIREVMSHLGKKGGSVTGSAAKKAACRANAVKMWEKRRLESVKLSESLTETSQAA